MSSEVPYQFFGVPTEAGLVMYKPVLWDAVQKRYLNQEVRITIEPRQIETSPEEQAYFRASIRWLITETEAFAGWDEKALAYYFKSKHVSSPITKEIHYPNGQVRTVETLFVPSTTDLGKKMMSFLINSMLRECAENGILIPEPSDFVMKKYSKRVRHVKHKPDQE